MTRQTIKKNWTDDPKSGRANSSPLFEEICRDVESMIRASTGLLIAGNVGGLARLIMAQLAHVHGLAPGKPTRKR